MVLLDYLMGIPSPKLNVPDRFEVVTWFSLYPTMVDKHPSGDSYVTKINVLQILLCRMMVEYEKELHHIHVNDVVAAADIQDPRVAD